MEENMSELWDNKAPEITRHFSLKNYIHSVYTADLIAQDINKEVIFDDYTSELKRVYRHFDDEIHRRVDIYTIVNDYADDVKWNAEFFNSVMSLHLNEAIRDILSEISERYKDVLALHPDKPLAELVETKTANFGWDEVSALQDHKTLRAAIEKRFTGREILGIVREKRSLSVGYSVDYFNNFPEEIKELSGKKTLTAAAIDDDLVGACMEKLLEQIYQERKEQILRHPEKKISELGAAKLPGHERD